jgi:hypothetical protein
MDAVPFGSAPAGVDDSGKPAQDFYAADFHGHRHCEMPVAVFFLCQGECMFRSKHDKEHKRYDLLPGQGGRAHRRKQKFILKWSVIAALIVSAILAAAMYWLNRPQP